MSTGFEGKYVGLIPIGAPANVITSGFKWDLQGIIEFGALVSTESRDYISFISESIQSVFR